jgi:alpha 1,3-glucosidase
MHSLGFHYCKYEENSVDLMIKRNEQFSHYNFPVDVFWSDLYYTEEFEYFTFNYDTWPISKVQVLNAAIEQSKRRLVMINDPHIRANDTYWVYSQGNALENASAPPPDQTNIFIRNPEATETWIGNCWPGPSAWIDYLNTNAAEFWKTLYLESNFLGTSFLYGTWNDMNEPSVFANTTEIDQLGMPMNNTHIKTDGTIVQHRWVHNAYGALMHRTSWYGLYARDQGQQRPFVLTRSTFLGSQRYGAMWTGDSMVSYEDVELYMQQALSLGISGMVFHGSDLPGFVGNPTDDNFIEEYQFGPFMPFMRAHANIDTLADREPWTRSPRVQQVVRNAIHLRYALIHYLYTTFKMATTHGLPIIRPMWYEFPTDAMTFTLDHQFMWGDSFLVAPKYAAPDQEHINFHTPINTPVYLPESVDWYYFFSGQRVNGTSSIQTIPIADNE